MNLLLNLVVFGLNLVAGLLALLDGNPPAAWHHLGLDRDDEE